MDLNFDLLVVEAGYAVDFVVTQFVLLDDKVK